MRFVKWPDFMKCNRRTNDLVKQANTLHSFVDILRVEFRKVRHAGEHHADLVPRL